MLKSATNVAEQTRSLQNISSFKKSTRTHTHKNTICSAENSKRGALYVTPSLFTFSATQPPEIGAMAKITLLHHVTHEKATPLSGLTSLWMKKLRIQESTGTTEFLEYEYCSFT
ncbi:hypothetical protein AVEN_121670-1 [Araneus ventricosus]|uniref:Uncharacterized protein n=1 Tax=Araneus ventricosus TaxID=182803 RepID=A0A4Y2VFR1_ARAVE|nr:hypothetical protein AVEN_121670-1 [Araneus ventricosus]